MNWKMTWIWTAVYFIMLGMTAIISIFACVGGGALSEFFYAKDLTDGDYFATIVDGIYISIFKIAFYGLIAGQIITWVVGLLYINPEALNEFKKWIHERT
jgi:hypothetical protein